MLFLSSPTAEQVFSGRPELVVVSAGPNHDFDNPCTPDLVEWDDIVCPDIAGRYAFADCTQVSMLEAKVPPHPR